MTYKNPIIFGDIDDYILGGFTEGQLKRVKVVGEIGITENKLKELSRIRLHVSLKKYFNDAVKGYMKFYSEEEAIEKSFEQIRSMLEQYLNLKIEASNDLDEITTSITISDQYQGWQIGFIFNFNKNTSSLLPTDLSSKDYANCGVSEDTVDEEVNDPNFISILESLSN
jgi:hypothetical protein